MPEQKTRFLDNPLNIRFLLFLFYIACALLLLLDFFISRHIQHPWENLFAFYPVFSFVCGALLVLLALLLRKLLLRREDYYAQEEEVVVGTTGTGDTHVDH